MLLNEVLSEALPQAEVFQLLHLQSAPAETHPIITQKPDNDDDDAAAAVQLTVKSQHFFVLFHNDKAIFGLEIYVYVTLIANAAERLIFVSKADTNGYCDCKVSFKEVTKLLIQYLLSIDPNYYLQKVIRRYPIYQNHNSKLITKNTSTVDALHILSSRYAEKNLPQNNSSKNQFFSSFSCSNNVVTKLCLFTRPAPQYLFAESSKNPKKHVIDGEKLLKWWMEILDDIICEKFEKDTKARLQIPGEEPIRIERYLRNMRYDGWLVGAIFGSKSNDLAAYAVPLFPDDPKSRFLHQLVQEDRIFTTTLKTFWTELQERQEFRLSVAVSVIGIEGRTFQLPQHIPQVDDVLLASSRKEFKYIRSYITGEEYDTVEGAQEAYTNVRDYLVSRLGHSMITIQGKSKPEHRIPKQERKEESIITILPVRKKPKK